MSMRNYTDSIHNTPQTEAIPGREAEMARNSAGGVAFKIDSWTQLDRFLVLGSEGGTYYTAERKYTADNAKNVIACIKEDGVRTVKRIVEVSTEGRAPKNTPAIFALALAARMGDEATKQAAYLAMPKVCRIGTHLFQWVAAMKSFGGLGNGAKRAIARWYQDMPEEKLALQAVKYQQREGWSHADVLRLAKPGSAKTRNNRTPEREQVFDWMTHGSSDLWQGEPPPVPPAGSTRTLWAFERAKLLGGQLSAATTRDMVELINEYNLPRECIPTEYLNTQDIWRALLENGGRGMPLTAMIRNLGKMSSIGLLNHPDSQRIVVEALSDVERLKQARVHPLQILVALATYRQGRGVRGNLTWIPATPILDALDGAFYKAFQCVEPTGKRWLLALDVSGSMSAPIAGLPGVDCRTASAAMAMVTAATEPNTHVIGFTDQTNDYSWYGALPNYTKILGGRSGISVLDLSPRRRLDDNIRSISRLPFGGTDCALPMIYASQAGIEADVFVVYTDNETWAGSVQPVQALRQYRQKTGINAKLIVVGMTATEFSIADPTDAGMLDVVGFDTAAPAVMAQFVR